VFCSEKNWSYAKRSKQKLDEPGGYEESGWRKKKSTGSPEKLDVWGCILSIAKERECVQEIKKLGVKRWIQEKAWNGRRWRMT
jgi:hypothetical protein